MADEYVSLYRQTLARRQRLYEAAISTGGYTPFLCPWDSLPALYLFLAIAFTPRLSPKLAKAVRYITFVIILSQGIYTVCHRRTLWIGAGYGIGLLTAWGVIMAGALLLCNNVARDFRRLEMRALKTETAASDRTRSAALSWSTDLSQGVAMTNRKVANVHPSSDTKQIFPEKPPSQSYELVWTGFPYNSGWFHVTDWTVDLITSFRAVGWQHRIPTVGPIDPSIPRDTSEVVSTIRVSNDKSRALQWRALRGFVTTYLVVDFLKTVMITDPYFMGLTPLESPSPWPWLARANDIIPIATRWVRSWTTLFAVVFALQFIFSLSPLFFATILPALVDVTKITKAPLLEPWMYPNYWQRLSTSVMYSGLAGFWGKCWHQMFRFAVSEPSRVLVEKLHLNPRGQAARTIQLLMAFTLSGSIHASASHTAFSLVVSRPFSGALLYFFLQGVGILVQSFVVKLLQRHVPWVKKLPLAVRQTVNALVVVTYLYFTGPLLVNDFAACGLWLYEPVPISFFRGLGFGPGGKDEGWWTWNQEGSRFIGLWKGDRWWKRAVAIY
ncbi:uncharacterized protein A1O5_04162 [Cladophialophora psammophila CBS 110553]|uniref:Wax synthase domain-containing protein n=1 Tax=Cladophialophora psammophila CBS 110553 TaxID=1182543 RepID=W9WYJ0_9EURO|nr:uncharacterized protein A1O5_04162 [Cladophialophora psammophila CBS 110553]EXJ73013.1 hypothetical protein A1O5_04162 [Cladophialophora psammophila CBS 110553]